MRTLNVFFVWICVLGVVLPAHAADTVSRTAVTYEITVPLRIQNAESFTYGDDDKTVVMCMAGESGYVRKVARNYLNMNFDCSKSYCTSVKTRKAALASVTLRLSVSAGDVKKYDTYACFLWGYRGGKKTNFLDHSNVVKKDSRVVVVGKLPKR